MGDERLLLDAALPEFLQGGGQAAIAEKGVGDDLLQLLRPQLMLFRAGRVRPKGVVRLAGLEGIMRVKNVEENKERNVAMVFEPGQQPVHVFTGGFTAVLGDRATFVQLLNALMQIGELASEKHRRG
jgi:hypothetical protein